MSHPYRDLSPDHFWSRSVAAPGAHEIDPVVEGAFLIGPEDKVATMGSCFAQHLSRFLQRSGLNYFVPEAGSATLSDAERQRRTYGVYSARFGNVYTVRQAVQLFDRCYERWVPSEAPWLKEEALVDPFRPLVEPDGFANADDLAADRIEHFAAVRRMFEESAVIVFTLGLTEGWRSRETGAVFPVVPGAAAGTFDPSLHEFVNFGVQEVITDLLDFADRVHSVNRQARILLTVSPVPLIATYSHDHVLTATTYSKSVLRVAAAEAEAERGFVHYFPSYEIVTGIPSGNRYFAPDLRSITDDGVAHVMRVFSRHYLAGDDAADVREDGADLRLEIARAGAVICDEEVLEPS